MTLLKDLDGFEALASDIALAWNASFDAVKDTLVRRQVRAFEEHGFRLLRFEETLPGSPAVDLQYELHFSPDYEYGLRGVEAKAEAVEGAILTADTCRPLVQAHRAMLEVLRARYGEPQAADAIDAEALEGVVRRIDLQAKAASSTAWWGGAKTQILLELAYTHSIRQRLRLSPVFQEVRVVNATGRVGLDVRVSFPGGRATAALRPGEDRIVEVPPGCACEVTARLASKECRASVGPADRARTVQVRRRWLTGDLYTEES